MDDALADKGDEAIADLFEEGYGFWFGHGPMCLHVLFKVAVAYFLHDVVVVAALHNLEDSYHVL